MTQTVADPSPVEGLPSISVAVCTYNGARYLAAQLDSLEAQSVRPSEIVICDDLSSDGTADVAHAFARRTAIPVRFIVNERQLGYRANFMKAARLCSAELVAFCDQDDLWLPGKLEACARAFVDADVMLVAHEALICDAAGTASTVKLYASAGNAASRSFLGSGPLVPWPNVQGFTEVVRRRLLDNEGLDAITDHFTGQVLAHDQIAVLAALDSGRVVFLPEPLALYRQHGGNVVGFGRCNLKPTLYRLFVNQAARLAPFARAARDRATFLGRTRRPGETAGPFAQPEIVEGYARLARIYELRCRMYGEARLVARWRLFRMLTALRAYGSRPGWDLSFRSRRQDIVFGLLLHAFLIRPQSARAWTLKLKRLP